MREMMTVAPRPEKQMLSKLFFGAALSVIMTGAVALNDQAFAAERATCAAKSTAPMDNVAMLQRVWGPIERGESQSFKPVFDLFTDDVVFKTALGEVQGKAAVMRYFASTGAMLDANPFAKPLEYYGKNNRVVQLGYETFTVKETGAKKEGEWAFVYDLRDGCITRMVNIQDLSGVEAYAARALAEARAGDGAPAAKPIRP